MRFFSVFLKITSGKISVAISENSQTINVAKNQVLRPDIDKPSLINVVNNRLTKVVTSATPPLKAGTLVKANFVINGSIITSNMLKTNTAVIKANPVILKPSSANDATNSPTALDKTLSTKLAISRIIKPPFFYNTLIAYY